MQDRLVFRMVDGGTSEFADFHRRLESHTRGVIMGELGDFDGESELMGGASLHFCRRD